MILIGITGYQCSGKDAVADILVREFGFYKINMAQSLYDIAYMFGWDGEKNSLGRGLLQNISDIGRAYDCEFVTKRISHMINEKLIELGENSKSLRVVVPGIRYKDQFDFIRNNNGEIWRVKRGDNKPKTFNDCEDYLDQENYDVVIENNFDTITNLKIHVLSVVRNQCRRWLNL